MIADTRTLPMIYAIYLPFFTSQILPKSCELTMFFNTLLFKFLNFFKPKKPSKMIFFAYYLFCKIYTILIVFIHYYIVYKYQLAWYPLGDQTLICTKHGGWKRRLSHNHSPFLLQDQRQQTVLIGHRHDPLPSQLLVQNPWCQKAYLYIN